nr:glycosyltransferase [Candidatus Freyrarchaeum guaymaensis]
MGLRLNVAVVSSSRGGVFPYTRKLVRVLQEHGLKVHFLLDRDGGLPSAYEGVYPCWSSGIRYPFQVFRVLCTCKPDIVHVQHEFFLYGGLLSALLFPLLLLLARVIGGRVVVTLHGVIPMVEFGEKFLSVNLVRGPLWLLKVGILLLTKVIVHLSSAVIVHEKFFMKVLTNDYGCPEDKIYVVPHGVDEVEERLELDEAKRMLGLEDRKVVLFFGYLAGYKGVETLIDGFKLLAERHADWLLIVGGGEHPRLKNKAAYRRYLAELRNRALSISGQTMFTGFIPDEELAVYISAADLIVLPYRLSMSSSGPFALAVSYKKPVVASNIPPFSGVLPPLALFRRGSHEELSERVERVLSDESARKRVSLHIRRVKEERSWRRVGLETVRIYRDILRTVRGT